MDSMGFLVLYLVLITLVVVFPSLLRRYFVPKVVAIMIAGILVGPNFLGLLDVISVFVGDGYSSSHLLGVVEAVGFLGLVFMMALAGMELRRGFLRLELKSIILLTSSTFSIPAAVGCIIYWVFRPGDFVGGLLYAALFASHSIGVLFPTIREIDVSHTRFGLTLISATVATDILSLLLLAVAVQVSGGSPQLADTATLSIFSGIDLGGLDGVLIIVFLAVVFVFTLVLMFLIPPIINGFFKDVRSDDDAVLTMWLMVVLMIIFTGELIGLNAVVGAFLAGMVLVRCKPFSDRNIIKRKLDGLGYGLLIPFLFLSIGMKSDLKLLFSAADSAALVALTITGLVLSKTVSGWFALYLSGFGGKKAFIGGLMTTPQLDSTLAAAVVGYEMNILDANFFNAVVCLSLFTTIVMPVVAKYFLGKWGVTFNHPEDKLVDEKKLRSL